MREAPRRVPRASAPLHASRLSLPPSGAGEAQLVDRIAGRRRGPRACASRTGPRPERADRFDDAGALVARFVGQPGSSAGRAAELRCARVASTAAARTSSCGSSSAPSRRPTLDAVPGRAPGRARPRARTHQRRSSIAGSSDRSGREPGRHREAAERLTGGDAERGQQQITRTSRWRRGVSTRRATGRVGAWVEERRHQRAVTGDDPLTPEEAQLVDRAPE